MAKQETRSLVIGFIGAGQLGMSLMRGLSAAGARDLVAYSVPADEHVRARVQATGARFVETPEGLSEADIVFSAVTPQAALRAASECSPRLAPHAIYVDINSMGPDQKREICAVVQAAGRSFVDGAVLGAAADGIRVPIVLAGEQADAVVSMLAALNMNLRVVGSQPGNAAAIKIVRSVLAKGMEALYVEALVAAKRLGVQKEVLDSFCAMLDGRSAASMAQLLVTTHVIHAERRMHELEMSVQALAAAGVPPVMATAVHTVLARSAASQVASVFDGQLPSDLDSALAALDDALDTRRP